MLKLILLDVSPYVIDGKQLKNHAWNFLEQNNVIDQYCNINNKLTRLLKKRRSLFICQSEYLKIIDSETYNELVNKWNDVYQHILNDYVGSKEVSENILGLLKDAKSYNVKVIFITNNPNYENLDKIFENKLKEKNIQILKLNSFSNLTVDYLVDYASDLDVAYDEIAVVTQQEATIDDLLENNMFAVTVNGKNKMLNQNLACLDGKENISIKQILYFYYEYQKNTKSGI